MTDPIAWIDAPDPEGSWGPPGSLALPLSDRGLLLADGLFETVLVEGGQPLLLAAHLERWHRSADLLAMAQPPGEAVVRNLLTEAVRRSGIVSGALRLNLSRGSPGAGARGIDLPAAGESPPPARFWLQLTPWRPAFEPLAVVISRLERRNADSLLSRCKTFAYGGSIQARREARARGADDALLLSTTGEVCCGTTANLLLRRDGRWLTPTISSGCLPGVMRGRALALGLAEETPLMASDLAAAKGALLINSLSCRPIAMFDGRALPHPTAAEAERFWRSLLVAESDDLGAAASGPS